MSDTSIATSMDVDDILPAPKGNHHQMSRFPCLPFDRKFMPVKKGMKNLKLLAEGYWREDDHRDILRDLPVSPSKFDILVGKGLFSPEARVNREATEGNRYIHGMPLLHRLPRHVPIPY